MSNPNTNTHLHTYTYTHTHTHTHTDTHTHTHTHTHTDTHTHTQIQNKITKKEELAVSQATSGAHMCFISHCEIRTMMEHYLNYYEADR
jgi:carbohydrate-binding DOMON domain-containing protein